jgi:hypothetical protein
MESMNSLVRHGRLALLSALLVAGGLATLTNTSLPAHAAPHPSITALGSFDEVGVSGSAFTPSGTVLVEVFDSSWTFVNSITTSAAGPHWVCRPTSFGELCTRDPGGEIDTGLYENPGYVHVIAYDYGSGTWSNWATTYVRMIP